MKANKSELRMSISFKETYEEIEIYNFIKQESVLIGQSGYLKMIVREEMRRQLGLKGDK